MVNNNSRTLISNFLNFNYYQKCIQLYEKFKLTLLYIFNTFKFTIYDNRKTKKKLTFLS